MQKVRQAQLRRDFAQLKEILESSPHGFHHTALAKNSRWRMFWIAVLASSVIALICCVIYYFYYVFTFAVYSRFLLQNPATVPWPTTILCDRQVMIAQPTT